MKSRFLKHPALNPQVVEACLESVPGVLKARVNPRAGSLAVRHVPMQGVKEKLVTALCDLPAKAYEQHQSDPPRIRRTRVAGHMLAVAAVPFAPPLVRAALALLVGVPVLVDGVRNLFARGVTAKSLDSASLGLCLALKDFRAVCLIACMRILGDYLQQTNEAHSNALLKKVFHLNRQMVWVERDGVEIEIFFQNVTPGDTVVCGLGELVAVDGVVLSGQAMLNKSCINGESLPVAVQEGDSVLSGSVVESGRIRIVATAPGESSALARVNSFLEQSLRDKSLPELRGEILADRLVPATLGIGAGTYLLTRDPARAASMLSIDYVCSVKFPAAVSVKSSMYAAGKSGMLLKGGSALDDLAGVDAVVFDKTGTLTTHSLRVTDVLPLRGGAHDALLALAARLEQHYDHPAAKAIVAEAGARNLPLPPVGQVEFFVSRGILAMVDGESARIGSRKHVAAAVQDVAPETEARAEALRAQGKIVLYVSRGAALQGLVALQSALRPEAQETIRELRTLGIKNVTVLTGDHKTTSQRLLQGLEEIDVVHCELAPEDKARIVGDLRKQGYRVAVVGDGVNDAPAFVSADIGVCMAQGADLAQIAARAVILNDDLGSLCAAIRIAKRQHGILDRCSNAGFVVNSLLLLLAACGALTPFAATTLHNCNTFSLMGYAALAAGAPVETRGHTLNRQSPR